MLGVNYKENTCDCDELIVVEVVAPEELASELIVLHAAKHLGSGLESLPGSIFTLPALKTTRLPPPPLWAHPVLRFSACILVSDHVNGSGVVG